MNFRSILIVLFCLCCGSVAAAVPDDEYQRAAREFEQLMAQTAPSGQMPRLQDKRAAELISVLADSHRFLDSVTYRSADLGSLMDMCGSANRMVMSYALFDIKQQVDSKARPEQVALQVRALMATNIFAYQGELERLQPFLIRCLAREIPLLDEFIAALKPGEFTEVRRAGLLQARAGIFDIYYGFLSAANDPRLDDSYRMHIFAALSDTAESYSAMLQLAPRQQIADLAKGIQGSAAANLRPYLDSIIEAMSNSDCSGLCSL